MTGRKAQPKVAATSKPVVEEEKEKETTAAGKSTTGEGMNPQSVARMLNLLRHRSDETTNKKGQDMEEAKAALEICGGLAAAEEKKFLATFEKEGGGKKWLLGLRDVIQENHQPRGISGAREYGGLLHLGADP